MPTDRPFNPLDKTNLGASVAEALLKRPVYRLPIQERFSGAGIYAIYYTGGYPPYRMIADKNQNDRFDLPIYVGEAVPEGYRKGEISLMEAATTYKLFSR